MNEIDIKFKCQYLTHYYHKRHVYQTNKTLYNYYFDRLRNKCRNVDKNLHEIISRKSSWLPLNYSLPHRARTEPIFHSVQILVKAFSQATEFQLCHCQPSRSDEASRHTRGDKKCITVQRTCQSRSTINMTGNKWVTTTSDKLDRLRTPIRDLDASKLTRHPVYSPFVIRAWSRTSMAFLKWIVLNTFTDEKVRNTEPSWQAVFDKVWNSKSNTLMSIYHRVD